MEKLRIAIAMPVGEVRDSFITPKAASRLGELGHLTWNPHDRQYTAEELAEVINSADVCVTGWGCHPFTEDVIRDHGALRMVAHTGGTVATIISKELYEKGIKVISGNKLYAESVAEGTIAYILLGLRNLPLYIDGMKTYGWDARTDKGSEALLEQKVGLVGFGAIAKYLVPMLKAFRNEIYVYDPHAAEGVFEEYGVTRVQTLEEMIPNVKILSLHMPLTPETYHMIDERLLALVPDGALFVNTARGSCVDEAALVKELSTGRFKAVLDVYEHEPLPMDSGLRGLANVTLIPHMAGPTLDRRETVTLALADDIERFFAGESTVHEIGYEYAMGMTNESSVNNLTK